MARDSRNVWELGEMMPSLKFDFSGARWRALALSILLGFTLVFALLRWGFPVHSDDGPGVASEAFQSPLIWKYPPLVSSDVITESEPGDLLLNGNMDQMGFYWRPPNHWVAGSWFEWFSREPFNFPEFNDGSERGFVHTRPSSQRLQLWGNDYAAGLMQSVPVTPCTTYRFRAYGQSRPGAEKPPPVEVPSHMKVGVEPHGWMAGRSIYDYDPGLEPEEFPETVVWSDEKMCYFTFEPYSVTVEALSDTMTAILYSNPEIDPLGGVGWHDTVWDTASLVEVQPPSGTLLDDLGVPKPDDLISNLTVTPLPHAVVVEWDTAVPASTQVVYQLVEPGSTVSEPTWLSYTLFLPALPNGLPILERYSPVDSTPVLHHRAVAVSPAFDYVIELAALSRRFDGANCVTSASRIIRVESPDKGYALYIPAIILENKEE